jgi:hypothetical protein
MRVRGNGLSIIFRNSPDSTSCLTSLKDRHFQPSSE